MFLSTPPSRVATNIVQIPTIYIIVSIHATLAGGDTYTHNLVSVFITFLSTPPSRVATRTPTIWFPSLSRFYPRHPRGWRRTSIIKTVDLRYVSIHATLAGGDCRGVKVAAHLASFYPRHPRGWRLWPVLKESIDKDVSIHATLAGGDRGWQGWRAVPNRFYPRHPRGWRHTQDEIQDRIAEKFLSTPPSRVATVVRLR